MIHLFKSSTCFEQLCAHPQEDNCINTTSGIITVLVAVRYTGRPLTQSDYTRYIEDLNKCIIEKTVRQVGYLPEIYEDARSEKY